MKKYLYLLKISILLTACGGSGDDEVNEPVTNNAPSVPIQVYPGNNVLCIDNSVNFSWNPAIDSENDPISYVLEISKSNTFSPLIETKTVSTTSTVISLEKGALYYWRVKATDVENSSNFSTSNSFYTEGNGISNHIPFAPELVSPSINTTINGTVTDLNWTASDLDNDALTYDVYVDTVNPPITKKGDNITGTTQTVTLEPSKKYYWRIVAKDGKGGITKGQVWSFKTN
ncbi:hypothetical protein SAMN05443543_11412 [Flavobacterium flevense]|uniref:Fibronectin type-III domain-containing protein n=1 Tax=Flavobacterium flevense TaxID=983 RepID=A0A4Y4B151_9FLAO|nr:hypothetical protein [Flavobacterium flevense]GEC72614.1 hypothetical protein FFL01_21530 [Flavobacterium flevense]SHM14961.1 hypothetical protein SAMN05443543_11412 [Flavobacterium flevense]